MNFGRQETLFKAFISAAPREDARETVFAVEEEVIQGLETLVHLLTWGSRTA